MKISVRLQILAAARQVEQTTGTSTNNSSVVLEVEEVYVSVGQQVKAGDALLKLTDESIEKYRKK